MIRIEVLVLEENYQEVWSFLEGLVMDKKIAKMYPAGKGYWCEECEAVSHGSDDCLKCKEVEE